MPAMNDALKNMIRPHFIALKGYVSAGMEADKTADTVFLNANENPYELPGLEGFNRYPEPQPKVLLEGYAKLYGVSTDNIVATRGADEAIVILTKLFCEPHQDKVLICPPTFGMYGVNGRGAPADVVEAPLLNQDGAFTLDVETIVSKLDDVKMVFLCSPNNPTGNAFAREDLLAVIEAAHDKALVVLDETYIEFADAESFTPLLASNPHLVILRTLSKSYSMAGMRMGCLLSGDADFIALARSKAMDAYPLPRASIEAALHVTKSDIQKIARKNIDKLLAERDRVIPLWETSPHVAHIYPSDTNFLLIKMTKGSAKAFCDFAKENGVILRDFSDKAGTENCIRLSIGTPEENDLVLTLLSRFAP
jgi:histidinol-phosphate aminotransferase